MRRQWSYAVLATALFLAGCATGSEASIRAQSLQTLDQASQHGSRG